MASFKSEQTKESYCGKLRLFLEKSDLELDELVELARSQPSKVEDLFFDFIETRKKEGVGGSTIHMARDAVKLLLEMNDIEKVNWKKIDRLIPRARRHGSDRPPSSEEIRRLLLHADLKMKCIILLLVSSGIRIGALEYLTWGDLEPIKAAGFQFAKLRVYSGEPEEYTTFVSPECHEALLEYRKAREDVGEKITRKSPLISIQLNERKIAEGAPATARVVKSRVIANKLGLLWKEMGLRETVVGEGKAIRQKAIRHEFKQAHGFRKFFKVECERFTKSLFVEIFMGHATGVTASYMKPPIENMIEEYVKAIPGITIMTSREIKSEREMRMTFLLLSGKFTKQEIEEKRFADLPYLELQKVMVERLEDEKEKASKSKGQIVVPVSEVKNYLAQGYDLIAPLGNGEAVLKPI